MTKTITKSRLAMVTRATFSMDKRFAVPQTASKAHRSLLLLLLRFDFFAGL